MTHARTQHPNARLTPLHRRNMVRCVINKGWTITATAERFQIDPKTVRKWRDRFLTESDPDLQDRATDRGPVRRYQRERPGELVHVDVNKIAAIPPDPG